MSRPGLSRTFTNGLEKPRLGGIQAIFVFIAALFAFTLQSDLTTHVETTLGYKQPYFIFYVAHGSFALVFPIHVLYLAITAGLDPRELIEDLTDVLRFQCGQERESSDPFPLKAFLKLLISMLLGMTGPGLLWYISVSFTSISTVTALWNSNAFWAYVFATWFARAPWDIRKIWAVVMASFGVVAIIYGGANEPSADLNGILSPPDHIESPERPSGKAPVLGDLLALAAAIWYGLFQVMYKIYVALPNDPERAEGAQTADAPQPVEEEETFLSQREQSKPHPGSKLPFGLYSNFWLSCVGMLTLVVLAIPFPILDALGIESFTLPPNGSTVWSIFVIAAMGLVFNASFMILLGLWGPVITSIGGLLTLILVLLSDVLFVEGLRVLTIWNTIGSFAIVGAFGVLASEFT